MPIFIVDPMSDCPALTPLRENNTGSPVRNATLAPPAIRFVANAGERPSMRPKLGQCTFARLFTILNVTKYTFECDEIYDTVLSFSVDYSTLNGEKTDIIVVPNACNGALEDQTFTADDLNESMEKFRTATARYFDKAEQYCDSVQWLFGAFTWFS
jgi:hypothetical protein